MIRRSFRYRITAFVLAGVLLAMAGIDAFGAHPCPHHDGLLGQTTTEIAPAHGHDAHATDAAQPAGETHDQHGPCNCVGDCTMSGGDALLTDDATGRAPVQVAIRTAAGTLPAQPLPGRPDFLIPFATAPPVPFAA